ncbi:hypothetical protein CDD83_1546 [Cordyceps sp. RAO-2017]|nr:hypothetical protein CDD83_1546 [Cordyceps sp. RAO-2017]
MTLAPARLTAALGIAYRLLLHPDPDTDHSLAFVRALGRHAFRLQTDLLRIPPRWGLLSPGPSRLQAMEACFVANLVATILCILLLVAFCLYRGHDDVALLVRCSTLIPVACLSTYLKARQYRNWVPLSWKSPPSAK